MFKINNDDLSIHLTRGDAVVFDVQAQKGDELYAFQPGDSVVFKVSEAKDAGTVKCSVTVTEPINANTMQIVLGSDKTTFGTEKINKHVDFWYEITLVTSTGEQTLIGFDEDGAKILRLYPDIG